MLEAIAQDVWIADGPILSFYGFPYPTRMGIVRLPSGELWVWSPVELNDALAEEVEQLGKVRHLVEPNKIHHLGLKSWKQRFPEARMYAPPGLVGRFESLHFDAELTDQEEPAFECAVKHVIVRGSLVMEEVFFLHAPSGTLFVGDLVQKHDPECCAKWQRWVMKLDGLAGSEGSTPREWRLTFTDRAAARSSVKKALSWNPERMVIAHGSWVKENGAEALRSSMSWLDLE